MRVNRDYWGSLGRRTIDALEAYRCYILRSVTTYSRHIAVSVKKRRNKVKKNKQKKRHWYVSYWMGYRMDRTNVCLSYYSKCIHCLLNSITLN